MSAESPRTPAPSRSSWAVQRDGAELRSPSIREQEAVVGTSPSKRTEISRDSIRHHHALRLRLTTPSLFVMFSTQITWNNLSPESFALTTVAEQEERNLNVSTTTPASGSQCPHQNTSSVVNQPRPQQASIASSVPQGSNTPIQRKRATDGEHRRSSKRRRTSPRPIDEQLKCKRSRTSSQEGARNLQQVADPRQTYDNHTVPWVDSSLVSSDSYSSASDSRAEGSSTRRRGAPNTFHDPSAVFSPFAVDNVIRANADPSEDSSPSLSSSPASTAGLQAIGGAEHVAGPSTMRPSLSSLQHTLLCNQTPQDSLCSAPSQAVHDTPPFPAPLPVSAIDSTAASDIPRSWSAASAAASDHRNAGHVLQPSPRALLYSHARERASPAGPSAVDCPFSDPRIDSDAGMRSSARTSSRTTGARQAVSSAEESSTSVLQAVARPRYSGLSPERTSSVAPASQPSTQRSPVSEPSSQMLPVIRTPS
ncbi:hypothetical protein C8Q73DRAFT_185185 [Cubamyces lactineus]|nr:hypothetical protein C8Q73DRAFT_185185 [Cubamyces lactineus]